MNPEEQQYNTWLSDKEQEIRGMKIKTEIKGDKVIETYAELVNGNLVISKEEKAK